MERDEYREQIDTALTETQQLLRQGQVDAVLILTVTLRSNGTAGFDARIGAASGVAYAELANAVRTAAGEMAQTFDGLRVEDGGETSGE